MADDTKTEFQMGLAPQSVDGFALASVLLVIVVLSLTAVPLLDMVMKNRENATAIRIISHLQAEARENLELSIYQVKLSKGFPPHYAAGGLPETQSIASQCTRRVHAINPEFLEGVSLLDPQIRQTNLTAMRGRQTASFVHRKPPSAKSAFDRYVIVSCALAAGGQIAIFGSEIASADGNFHTLSSGQF